MHNLQISVHDSAYPSFKKFLGTFKKNEVKVISEEITDKNDPIFLKHQKELHETLKRIESGEAKLLSQEEFEESLNRII
jgi:hypothetical protein